MILIVADTGPINYLVQIGHIDLLPRMVDKTVLPTLVRDELLHTASPAVVRNWATNPPAWIEVRSASLTIDAMDISAADREAIALARESSAAFLLMDDSQARQCAARFGVVTMGTLGLLDAAAGRGLVSLPAALDKLRATSCFLTDDLIENALQRDAERRR